MFADPNLPPPKKTPEQTKTKTKGPKKQTNKGPKDQKNKKNKGPKDQKTKKNNVFTTINPKHDQGTFVMVAKTLVFLVFWSFGPLVFCSLGPLFFCVFGPLVFVFICFFIVCVMLDVFCLHNAENFIGKIIGELRKLIMRKAIRTHRCS